MGPRSQARRPAAAPDSDGAALGSTRRPTPTQVLIASQSLAFAVLVGIDGPAPWPAVRAAVVLLVGAGCIAAPRRLGRRSAATAIIVFGLAAIIGGAGIGISHLVEDGTSPEAIAGALTLAGGLALVALGSTRLIRSAHRWSKLLALPIGVATLALVVMPLTLAVFVTNAPPFVATTVTPADRGLADEDVSIVTADGVRLTGWYVASNNGASIIVLGGVSGISEREVNLAAMLVRHGYGSLLLNLRGQGESQGDAMMWGWWGEVDVAAGVDYLAHRPDVSDGGIGAIGMSVGGEQAIAAAGVDARLRAVVSEGASARGARDEGDSARGVGGLLVRYVDWVSKHAASTLTDADRPTSLRESMARYDDQRALLIAAGTSEPEIAATEAFRAAAPDLVEVWIAPDATHTEALRTHPDEWEHRVVCFLDDTLEPR